jgi:hypothetical protein
VRFLPPATIKHLSIEGELPGSTLAALFASPYAGALRTLRLTRVGLDEEKARVIARGPLTPRLQTLSLDGNGLDAAGLDEILAPCDALERLYLRHEHTLGTDGVERLARSTRLQQLTALSLKQVHMGCAGAQALASAAGGRLRYLVMEDGGLAPGAMGKEGAQALGQAPLLHGLKTLKISGTTTSALRAPGPCLPTQV